MKRLSFKWILPVVAMPMLMASCNSDEPRPEIQQYVTIDRVGVGELQTRYDASDNFLPTSGIMKLMLNSSNADSKYSTSGLDFKPTSNGWSTPNPLVWAVNSSADWSVFFTSRSANEYSYDADSRVLAWSVPADQSKLSDEQFEGLDLLYDGGKSSSASLSPALKHAMSKIVINYYCEVDVENDIVPDSVIITNVHLSRNVEVEVGDGWQILPYENTTANDIIQFRPVGTPTATKAKYEAIVIPRAKMKSYVKAIMKNYPYITNGELRPRPRAISNYEYDDVIEPGKIYTFNFYYKGKYGSTGDMTISPWEEVNNAGSLVTDEEL